MIWGALACAIRPTAAVILFPLFVFQLVTTSERLSVVLKTIFTGYVITTVNNRNVDH